MDHDVLRQQLRILGDAYSQTDRSAQRLGNTIARSSVLAAPAAGAIQQLSKALFAQTAEQGKSIDALETRLRALSTAERAISLRREEHLQRMAGTRQEIKTLTNELSLIQRGLADAKNSQMRLEEDRADLVRREAALASLPQRNRAQNRELVVIRNQKSDVAKESTRANSDVNRLEREAIRNVEAQAKAQAALNQSQTAHYRGMREQIGQVRQQRLEFELLGHSTLSVSHALRDAGSSIARIFTFTGAAMAIRESQAFNQTLLATNSSLATRMELWRGALEVQGRTGDSLKNLGELMGVLRGQAQLYRKDWTDVLTVASKLSQGLGASSAEISEMLNASRALKISFRELADSVTNVVDKTSLSVRETTTLVMELRRVLTGFNAPAVGGAIDGPLRNLAALEQAMKERGATEGSALRVLKQFTSMQQKGGVGLGLLGSGGVDFLRDPSRTDTVIRNLAKFLEPVRNIPIVFEQMAASVGLAADDAQILIDASKNLGRTQQALANSQIDLNKRFAQQAGISGQVWSQFGRQLQALLLEGLTPLTKGVAILSGWVVKLREFIVGVKEATPDWVKEKAAWTATGVALVAMGAAALAAARRVALTTQALWALAAGGPKSVATGSLLSSLGDMLSKARRFSRSGPLLGVPRAAGVLPTIARGAAGFLSGLLPLMTAALPVLIPAVLIAVAAWGVSKFLKDKAENQNKLDTLSEEIRRRQEAYPKIGARVTDALKNRDGVMAAQNALSAINKKSFMEAAEKGDTGGIEVLRKARVEAVSRLNAGLATESRVTGLASTERISELRAGQAALLAAVEQLDETLREVSKAQASAAVKLQQQVEMEKKQAAEKAQVRQAALRASSSETSDNFYFVPQN